MPACSGNLREEDQTEPRVSCGAEEVGQVSRVGEKERWESEGRRKVKVSAIAVTGDKNASERKTEDYWGWTSKSEWWK